MCCCDDAFGDRVVVLTAVGGLAVDAVASAFGHRVAAGRAVAFQSFATTTTTAATAIAFARLGIVAFGPAGFGAWGDRLGTGRAGCRNHFAAFVGNVVAGIGDLIVCYAFIAVVTFDRAVGATATTAPATALAILGRTGVYIAAAAGGSDRRIGFTNFGVTLQVVGEFVDRRSGCAWGAVRATRRASLTGGSGAGEGIEFADGGFARSRRFGQSLVASRFSRLTWLTWFADFARGITGFTVVAGFARFAGRFTAGVTAAFTAAFSRFARLTTFALFTGFTGFAGLAVVAQLAALAAFARRALFFSATRWA
jgi:hypothetical protein